MVPWPGCCNCVRCDASREEQLWLEPLARAWLRTRDLVPLAAAVATVAIAKAVAVAAGAAASAAAKGQPRITPSCSVALASRPSTEGARIAGGAAGVEEADGNLLLLLLSGNTFPSKPSNVVFEAPCKIIYRLLNHSRICLEFHKKRNQ